MVLISLTSYAARCMNYSSGDRMVGEDEVVRQNMAYLMDASAGETREVRYP